jgi:hypothetical protein
MFLFTTAIVGIFGAGLPSYSGFSQLRLQLYPAHLSLPRRTPSSPTTGTIFVAVGIGCLAVRRTTVASISHLYLLFYYSFYELALVR